jgi:signal peptidase I
MKRIVARIAVGLLLAVTLTLVGLLVIVPRVGGYRTYVVTGRSMTGTISIGSLVYDKPVSVWSLRKGDIITFVPPEMNENVTHRIVGIRVGSDGKLRISTKGDAVRAKDPWEFTPLTPDLPREEMAIPYLGYAIAILSLRVTRVLLFALPALMVAIIVLVRLWRESDEAPAPDNPDAGASSPPARSPAVPVEPWAKADTLQPRAADVAEATEEPRRTSTDKTNPVIVPLRVWEAMP